MKYNLTEEQQAVVDYMLHNDGMVLVDANAGSGKSFLAKHLTQELPVVTGIYTAFNKAIVEEMADKFRSTQIECKTLHSLAYRYVSPRLPIKEFNYKDITETLAYSNKRKVIDAINSFFVSSSVCIYDYFSDYFKETTNVTQLTELSIKYVQLMAEEKVSPTFNFLLKSLHLMLVEKTVVIEVDIMITDELQDSMAVSLEIFREIKAKKKVGLGNKAQAIYAFLNLSDGFEVFKDTSKFLKLTRSFRCSKDVATMVERKMRRVLDKDFKFTGTDTPCMNGKTLYVTLTNSFIVDEIQSRLEKGKSFTLLRKPSDIFEVPLAVSSASQGKVPYQARFAYLADLYKDFTRQSRIKTYQSYLLSELDDDEVNSAIRLLSKLRTKGINLFTLYADAKKVKADPEYTISSTHTVKGLEFETVYVADDLNTKMSQACAGELEDEDAETVKKIYYVACTRCGPNLYNATEL